MSQQEKGDAYGLARMRRMVEENGPPPVARLIGFHLAALEAGRAVFVFEADGRHANPMGTLHGGILCDVADAAMGFAFGTTLKEGESFTTLELKINFLKPVWKARLTAEGRVMQRGKTVGLVECEVFDEGRRRVAHATSTCLVLKGEEARGR
jgi:uncharacterized protein (TIGR00369 family)